MEPAINATVDDMAQLMTIRLNRQDAQPWGFRLQGGKDFGTPLVVQKVNGGSLADQAGLNPGDAVIKINNVEVFNLRHKDAQDVVVRSGNNFDLTIQRGGATWRPSVTPTGSIPSPSSHLGNNIPTVTRTSLAHKPQEVQHIGSGYNNAARPFSGLNGNDGPVKSIVNKQYNTPVGIYSEEAIAETLSAQAEVLAGGVLGVNFKKNEKIYSGANSEVLKMLHEQENDQSEPAESHHHQYQPQSQPQHNITSPTPVSHHQQSSPNLATKHVSAPIDRPKAPNTGGLPAGQNICAECERLIVGVFIRIKDKNLHAECFKCATCGTSLKNQGYFNFNNKLYCDIHARLAAMNNPPKGTEGHFPVPIKSTQKLSANTISAALDAHVQHNGSSNHDTRTSSVSPSSYTHSRTSSSSSSIGGTTSSSTISSLSPNKSSSPEKLSPAHSRQSSETGSCTNVSSYHHHLAGNSRTITPTVSPSPPPQSQTKITLPANAIIYNNEITINHKQNENDMNRNNRNEPSSMGYGGDGTTDDDDGGHVVPAQPQTNTYNKFLKNYANKMQNDFLDGSISNSISNDHKSSSALDLNDSECNFVTMTTTLPAPSTNGYSECPPDSIYGTIRPQNRNQQSNEEFQYVTLAGSVIKSVIAPGKGVKTNYKINTGYGGPKPFNTSPMHPPMRGPQSPSTYPPPTTGQSWSQPQPKQPMNPYATLPRAAAGQSHDTPHELTPSIAPSPVVMQTMSNAQHESASYSETRASESQYHHQQQQQLMQQQQRSSVPIIVTENSGPITMAFQSLDHDDHSSAHPRPYTPSLINHPAPVIPFYQTAEKLVAEECLATPARLYDPRSPSPLPGRTHSPAPGPPPNPLNAIRAPRLKDRPIQAGSITTGQSYYGAQTAQYQTEQQGNLVSHYQTGYQSGSQMFTDKPEVVQQHQIGDMTVQTRAKESQMSEENRSEMKSKSSTQVGNMQIERHRKVIEEFEHTQTAKSVEILKTHGENREIGKTGFVANQARRLSGLEQEISAITSQSQAISARAAASLADYESTFPQYKSPEPVSTFPIKTALPPHDEPQRPTYVISQNATNKVVSRPPGFNAGPAAASMAASASNFATLSSSSSAYGQSTNKAAAQSSIMASSISSSAATTASSNLTTAIPVPAFKPPVPFGGSAAGLGTNSEAPLPSNQPQFLTNNNNSQQLPTNNAYKPTPSTGPAGFKAPPLPPSNIIPNVVNDPSPASAGPNKGGVFGATSAPKRGRGILNKAVGPGVRVPLCGCCNSQIRGPFITALGRIWCPDHFVCVNGNCRRALQDIGFVEEKGDLYCEYCFEKFLAPTCSKCNSKIKGDCLNAIGKHFHPECFTCTYCGKLFGNSPFFLEEGEAYCEADWNELFTTKCFACGFPVEAGDRWVEALNHNYHSQCFNCTMCKKNLEGQSFYNKGGRPFCKNHAR